MSKTKLTISKWKPLPVSYNERCLKPRADPASNVRGGGDFCKTVFGSQVS